MAVAIIQGDARHLPLPDGCVDLVCCSPPYFGLRSYTDGGEHYGGQIGSEATPQEWLAALVECTREMVRVLKPEGSIFINLGDKYAGSPRSMPDQRGICVRPGHNAALAQTRSLAGEYQTDIPAKSLLGLPWRYALACTDQLGLILRRDIIWAKPNGLPESVTDRCRSAHEYVFHLVRQPRYYSAVDEIREGYAPGTAARYAAGYNPDREAYAAGGPTKNGVLRHDGGGPTSTNPLGKLPGSVWAIPSQPLTVPASVGVDHFAAFPVELPRRIVLGWSPPGVCVACGQGRRPVSTVDYRTVAAPTLDRRVAQLSVTGHSGRGRGNEAPYGNARRETTITGYACACNTADDPGAVPAGSSCETIHVPHRGSLPPTRPAVVLDPFMGTGTTLLAAAAYGRHAIGIDRSADYCRLATWRTHDPAERAKAMQVPKPPPVTDGQDALFAI